MRDLGYIAEINGPRSAELQAERAANVKKNSTPQWAGLFQTLHGERARVNGQPNGYSAVTEAELLAPYISGDDVDLSPDDRHAVALDRRADDVAARAFAFAVRQRPAFNS
jgi:hypothetical protein